MNKEHSDYDHTEDSLVRACGFDTDSLEDLLDNMHEVLTSSITPSKLVQKMEDKFNSRELALLLVNVVLSTQRILEDKLTPEQLEKITVRVPVSDEDDEIEKEEIG